MTLYDVTVDDPDMAKAHRYRLEAPDTPAARLDAARRAIADDEIGAVPDGNDEVVAQIVADELTRAIPVDGLVVHE